MSAEELRQEAAKVAQTVEMELLQREQPIPVRVRPDVEMLLSIGVPEAYIRRALHEVYDKQINGLVAGDPWQSTMLRAAALTDRATRPKPRIKVIANWLGLSTMWLVFAAGTTVQWDQVVFS